MPSILLIKSQYYVEIKEINDWLSLKTGFKNLLTAKGILLLNIWKHRKDQWKVDRELANHSLSSTASQGTSNIPFPWFLMLGCNSQAQEFMNPMSTYEWNLMALSISIS